MTTRIEEYEKLVRAAIAQPENDDLEDQLREIDLRAGLVVPSESQPGVTYTVRFVGRGDADEVLLWECNCPAARHGRNCKHLSRVWAVVENDPTID